MKEAGCKTHGRQRHEERMRQPGGERNLRRQTVFQLWARRSPALLLAVTGAAVAWIHVAAQTPTEPADKYLWLEDVHGERSMAWVKAENERSARVIENDPHFAGLEAAALKVLESPDRLPTPQINGGDVYNTWQDARHVRGILRRTSVADYLAAQPHWQTVLDYDALAKQDNESWVQEGLNCLYPGNDLCLVALSAGGEDAVTLEDVKKDPRRLKPMMVFAPSAREFAQSVNTTKNRLLLTTLENVQGRVYACALGANGVWTRRRLDVPDNRTVSIVSTNWSDDQFFLSLDGFLTPSSLWLGNAGAGTLKEAKALPPQFDASRLVVEQLEAISSDGTKVPYFVVRRKDIKYDGANPTVLTAYGGFQYSVTPTYSAPVGKLWLERGGVFVLANIRGGGEFGPAWHEAGLKTHRQRIYDDFAAVGRDLVTRRITSPRRFGIVGGSNGGLLMGVEMTQHPEMWNAIVIAAPLLDMLRFEQIAAGASWVGEYGSANNTEERAFLASISPYYQLKPDVHYPEPLIFTTTTDDRVGPVHARKFAAKMEELKKPFFYEEIIEGGHSAGADLKEQAKTAAFRYTYLTRKLMD
jgi:prolyl oligopeptidase